MIYMLICNVEAPTLSELVLSTLTRLCCFYKNEYLSERLTLEVFSVLLRDKKKLKSTALDHRLRLITVSTG